MSCPDQCTAVQFIGMDGDPSMSEQGELVLTNGQLSATIQFVNLKSSDHYRFEYLYVDALGLVTPGVISCVPTYQSVSSFTVQFAGAPIATGYVLRWRVVVAASEAVTQLDAPESVYVRLPRSHLFTYLLVNPRSVNTYGFSELRVENLTDPDGNQTPILPQVVSKQTDRFSVALSTTPNTDNYFLVARIP